ncbi:hypothetical protein F4778DRAFT_73153 [Xylariomycetidae sp. FL2044]|nr:hypothetical protein F4778DRAFT_73153 [Xylariomycetidae sp. FL2044]
MNETWSLGVPRQPVSPRSPRFTRAPRPQPRTARRVLLAEGVLISSLALAWAEPSANPTFGQVNSRKFKSYIDDQVRAFMRDDLEAARQGHWQLVRDWLSANFRGALMDEGPLEDDHLLSLGYSLYSTDTRIFTVIPEEHDKLPVVCITTYSLPHPELEPIATYHLFSLVERQYLSKRPELSKCLLLRRTFDEGGTALLYDHGHLEGVIVPPSKPFTIRLTSSLLKG